MFPLSRLQAVLSFICNSGSDPGTVFTNRITLISDQDNDHQRADNYTNPEI